MECFVLTDAQWAKMEAYCLGKPTDPGRSGGNNRLFMEAVLWIARTGSPWRDLSAQFGNWSTAFRRFSDWRKADVFKRIFEALSDEPDMEYAEGEAGLTDRSSRPHAMPGALHRRVWSSRPLPCAASASPAGRSP
jgi:transposase